MQAFWRLVSCGRDIICLPGKRCLLHVCSLVESRVNGVPVVVQRAKNPIRGHEDGVSIPGLTQWVKDLALLWLRCRPAAVIPPPAWELPYATSAAIKKKKKKRKEESRVNGQSYIYIFCSSREGKITGCWSVGVPDPQFLRSPARGGVPSPLSALS